MYNQYNPVKIPVTFLTVENSKSTIHKETEKTLNSKRNPKQKDQCWRFTIPDLRSILQSHRDEDNMILAHKQTCRSMKQNRGSNYTMDQ